MESAIIRSRCEQRLAIYRQSSQCRMESRMLRGIVSRVGVLYVLRPRWNICRSLSDGGANAPRREGMLQLARIPCGIQCYLVALTGYPRDCFFLRLRLNTRGVFQVRISNGTRNRAPSSTTAVLIVLQWMPLVMTHDLPAYKGRG